MGNWYNVVNNPPSIAWALHPRDELCDVVLNQYVTHKVNQESVDYYCGLLFHKVVLFPRRIRKTLYPVLQWQQDLDHLRGKQSATLVEAATSVSSVNGSNHMLFTEC